MIILNNHAYLFIHKCIFRMYVPFQVVWARLIWRVRRFSRTTKYFHLIHSFTSPALLTLQKSHNNLQITLILRKRQLSHLSLGNVLFSLIHLKIYVRICQFIKFQIIQAISCKLNTATVFTVSSEILPHLVASYDKKVVLRTQSSPDLHRIPVR